MSAGEIVGAVVAVLIVVYSVYELWSYIKRRGRGSKGMHNP